MPFFSLILVHNGLSKMDLASGKVMNHKSNKSFRFCEKISLNKAFLARECMIFVKNGWFWAKKLCFWQKSMFFFYRNPFFHKCSLWASKEALHAKKKFLKKTLQKKIWLFLQKWDSGQIWLEIRVKHISFLYIFQILKRFVMPES